MSRPDGSVGKQPVADGPSHEGIIRRVHLSAAFGSRYGKDPELVWAAVDSNHLPPRYQHGALPVELAAQARAGLEMARAQELESNGSPADA